MPYEKYDDRLKWTLLEFVSPAGRGAIVDWRNDLPTAARKADMDTFLRDMAKKSNWAAPDLDGLRGKGWKGLFEIRWKSDGVPHRIGGFFLEEPKTFAMLIGWTHNKRKYDPSSALKTIVTRKHLVETGDATLRVYEINTGRTIKGQGI